MYHFKKDTTIAGISELRTHSREILNHVKKHDVVLQKHGEPTAVIIDYKKYLQHETLLDLAEDYILGSSAMERDSHTKQVDYIDIEKW